MEDKKLSSIIQEIRKSFRFLFEKGFELNQVKKLPMGDWWITFSRDNFGIVIYSDQGEIGLIFSPLDTDMRYRVGLEGMIYYLNRQQIDLGRMNRRSAQARRQRFEMLARLLQDYLDQVAPYFGESYDRYKHEILVAQQEALDLYLNKHIPRHER